MNIENEKKAVAESLEDAVSVVMESTWPHYLLTPEKMKDIWNDMDYPKVKEAAENYRKEYAAAFEKNQTKDMLVDLIDKFTGFMKNEGFDGIFARWVANYIADSIEDTYTDQFEPNNKGLE